MPKSDKGDVSNLIPSSQCLKITEKVAFNIASEASYVCNGQKFIKNAKNGQFWWVFETKPFGQTMLPDRSILVEQKLMEIAKVPKIVW